MIDVVSAFSGFSVDDIDKASTFYKDTLGVETEQTPMGLNLKLSGTEVFIYPKPDHTPANFTVLNFVVADINAAIAQLSEAGVHMEHYDNLPAPQDERGVLRGKAASMGPDIAWFLDPAGNVLGLVED